MFLFELLFSGFGFWWLILIIVSFVKIGNLKKRVKKLESQVYLSNNQQHVSNQEQTKQAAPPITEMSAASPEQVAASRQAAAAVYASSTKHDKPEAFGALISWLREEWLMKLGSLLMLFGFGWFVNTNNWLGDIGSVTFGIFVGAAVLILGAWRIKNDLHQGSVFLVLGSTVVLLTIYAARNLYGLFDPYTALFVSFLSTVFVAFVSVKRKIMGLAVASLLLASIAPMLVGGGASANYVALFSYLTVIILGAVWVVKLTGWRSLTLLSLIMAFLHSIPVLSMSGAEMKSTILLFAYALASIFYIFNTIGLLRTKDNKTTSDVVTAALNGIFLLVWILAAAQKEWQSIIIITWMLVFVAGAFVIFRKTMSKTALYIYAGVGIAMLAAATTIELDGPVMTIAYTIESAVISLIMFGALKNHITGQKYSLLLIGPMLFAFDDIERYSRANTVLNQYFFSVFILALCLMALGLAYRYYGKFVKSDSVFAKFYIVQVILSSLYLYTLLWGGLHNGMGNRDSATMVAIVIFTIIGLATNIYGKIMEKRIYFFYGGTMLILVVARLLLVDFANMDNNRRIITFFFIGFLLIGAAFASKKNKIDNNLAS